MVSQPRALCRLTLYLGWTALLLPFQVAVLALRLPFVAAVPRAYHNGCLRLLGLTVEARGRMSAAGPTLFVANHSSYLDIPVLGALVPGSFVAKSEVAGWPLFGLLAKLQRTVFVERAARHGVHAQRDEIRRRLEAGDNLILFPEGTSSDGNRTLPFKSALFSATGIDPGAPEVLVQPVSIAYTRLDGMPLGRRLRPLFAWYGGMALMPHLWQMLGLGKATVEVEFHPAVSPRRFSSRHALAQYCHGEVAEGVAAAIAGRGRGSGRRAQPAAGAPAAGPEAAPAKAGQS